MRRSWLPMMAAAALLATAIARSATALPDPMEMLLTPEQIEAARFEEPSAPKTPLTSCIIASKEDGDMLPDGPDCGWILNTRDTAHYARGTTLIWHILVNHAGGSWETSEISTVGSRAAVAKQYYRDFAPSIAYIRFDHEDEEGFYYYTPTLPYEIEVGGDHWGDWVNDACIALGVVDGNGDGKYSDDLTLGLQSWGGWDNVIAIFQPADLSFRGSASIERGACQIAYNDWWTVYAHEWGHCFGNCDEYAEDSNGLCNGHDCSWICQSCYVNDDVPNGNCEVGGCPTIDCIMKYDSEGGDIPPCEYTARNWAWIDANDNGILDATVWKNNGVAANMHEIIHNGYFIHTNTTWGMVANQRWTSWSAIGVRSRDTANYQLSVYADNNHRWLQASSSMPGSEIDFVVGNFNHNILSQDHIELTKASGSGQYVLSYEAGNGMLYPDGVVRNASWNDYNVVRTYDVPLIGGERIGFTLDIDTPGLDLGMALFHSDGAYWTGRAGAVWEEDDWPAGLSESRTYVVPHDDVYGLVVWANTEVDGNFSIQIGPTMYELAEESPTSSYLDLSLYSYTPNAFSWAVSAARPGEDTNLRLQLFEDAHFENLLATSGAYPRVEFIAADYNPSKSTDYLRVFRQSGADYKRTEWEQDDEILTGFETGVWEEDHIVKVWDVHLTQGMTYMFRQYEGFFSPLHAGIYVMSSHDGDRYIQRSGAASGSINSGQAGEWFLYTAPASDFYGFVMTMNDATSNGSYSVGMGPRISLLPKTVHNLSDEVVWTDVPDVEVWSAAGVRPETGSESEVHVWDCEGFGAACYLKGDASGPGIRYMAIDGHEAPDAPYYPRFDRVVGTGDQTISYDNAIGQSIVVSDPDEVETAQMAFSTQTVLNVWDLNVHIAPILLEIMVTPLEGNLDVGVALFGSDAQDFIQRSYEALESTNDFGPGQAERLLVDVASNDIYGLVILNQNGASGGYRIDVRDAAASDVGPLASLPERLGLRAIGSAPSPGPVGLELALPARAGVRLDVFDVQGRRVRGLLDAVLEAGTHAASWDGRDETGRAASAGSYFVRMESRGESRTVKVVRIE